MANIVLRCADERINEITNKKFGDCVTLGELGGIKWYLSRDGIEELFEQIEFAIDHKEAKSLALVSHTDCGLYKELGEDDREQYLQDLEEAKTQITERFPELAVSTYLYNLDTKELEKITTESPEDE